MSTRRWIVNFNTREAKQRGQKKPIKKCSEGGRLQNPIYSGAFTISSTILSPIIRFSDFMVFSFFWNEMAPEGLLDWYCRPVENGKWATLVTNAFGAYTPCAIETMVVALSHLVLWCLICYRIWLISKDFSVKRFRLQSSLFNYVLGALAAYNTAEPLYRAVMGISVVNLDGQGSLAPFEVSSSLYTKQYLRL